jgi:hypothetical protein
MTYTIHFTAKDGSQAKITGDWNAIVAIEDIFARAGIRWDAVVETWDEGFYATERQTA